MKTKANLGFALACFGTLTLAGYALVVAAEGTKPENRPVKSWEHLALTHDGAGVGGSSKLSNRIVSLGNDGWELVDVSSVVRDGTTTKTIFYFKRPK